MINSGIWKKPSMLLYCGRFQATTHLAHCAFENYSSFLCSKMMFRLLSIMAHSPDQDSLSLEFGTQSDKSEALSLMFFPSRAKSIVHSE